jgi:hypothetical protein
MVRFQLYGVRGKAMGGTVMHVVNSSMQMVLSGIDKTSSQPWKIMMRI